MINCQFSVFSIVRNSFHNRSWYETLARPRDARDFEGSCASHGGQQEGRKYKGNIISVMTFSPLFYFFFSKELSCSFFSISPLDLINIVFVCIESLHGEIVKQKFSKV